MLQRRDRVSINNPSFHRQHVENRTNDAFQALRCHRDQRDNPEILYPDSRRCQGTFLRCIYLHVRRSITSPTPQQKSSLALASHSTHNPGITGGLVMGCGVRGDEAAECRASTACAAWHVREAVNIKSRVLGVISAYTSCADLRIEAILTR